MKWSWKVGQLAGVDLRIHATFVILLGWIGVSYWLAGHGAATILGGFAFIAALFACVVLHELGHALAARGFGIATRDITLLPIGGLARLERMPEQPKQELWIALAGPAVNVAIAAVLFGWLSFHHQWAPLAQLKVATGPFVERLLIANLWLVLFNLIPAFPMDGGRVLRAALAWRMTYVKATQLAAVIGQGLALVFALIGLFTNPLLLIVGLFVWLGARQEAAAVETKAALSATQVRSAMLTDFEFLHPGDTLAEAVRLTLKGSQRDFPVVDQGRAIGMLFHNDLLAALAEWDQQQPVLFTMRREFPVAEPGQTLDVVFQQMRQSGIASMPVVRDGYLVGLITADAVQQHLAISAVLEQGLAPEPAPYPEPRRRAG